MGSGLGRVFLKFSVEKLNQLTKRIVDCLERLTGDQIWARAGEDQNAIGNLVLHLCGNVQQWIVSGVGGAPDVRVRDREFSARGDAHGSELIGQLCGTVAAAAVVLEQLSPERLGERIQVQQYDLTILEAIYHVVEHFSQHTGQILFATKALTGADLGYYAHLARAAHNEKTP